jgi:hypothetical protein
MPTISRKFSLTLWRVKLHQISNSFGKKSRGNKMIETNFTTRHHASAGKMCCWDGNYCRLNSRGSLFKSSNFQRPISTFLWSPSARREKNIEMFTHDATQSLSSFLLWLFLSDRQVVWGERMRLPTLFWPRRARWMWRIKLEKRCDHLQRSDETKKNDEKLFFNQPASWGWFIQIDKM